MPFYKIRNWNEIYENSDSRKVRSCTHLHSPNKHSASLRLLIAGKDGLAHLGVFKLLADLASRVKTPFRDGRVAGENGRLYSEKEISIVTGADEATVKAAIQRLSQQFDWIEVTTDAGTFPDVPGDFPEQPGEIPKSPGVFPSRREGKGREGNPTGGSGGDRPADRENLPAARRVLAVFNAHREILPRGLSPSPSNLKEILARLRDGRTESDLVSIVEHKARECAKNPAAKVWFHPRSMFRESNFERNLNMAASEKKTAPAVPVGLPPVEKLLGGDPEKIKRDLAERAEERRAKFLGGEARTA